MSKHPVCAIGGVKVDDIIKIQNLIALEVLF